MMDSHQDPTLAAAPLLAEADGKPVEVHNGEGRSPVVLVCEHASNRIPRSLGNLGLSSEQLKSHVAWDPGAFDLAVMLSQRLDAPLVAARFSRLVYDCNRPPVAESAMPSVTEVCAIPGNASILPSERLARTREIYVPFHAEVAAVLAKKRQEGLSPVLITIHSFTPVFEGRQRFVEIGYLHGPDRRLASEMLKNTNPEPITDVRLNEPYGPQDGVLHTIERHTGPTSEPNVMIEIRNDLLQSDTALHVVRDLISAVIIKSLAGLNESQSHKAGHR